MLGLQQSDYSNDDQPLVKTGAKYWSLWSGVFITFIWVYDKATLLIFIGLYKTI